MKILIDNRTNLCNTEVGHLIDFLQEIEKGQTQYYGKWKGYELNNPQYEKLHVETMVKKRYLKILIYEDK